MKLNLFRWSFLFAAVLALWACGGSKDDPVPEPEAPTAILLSVESISAGQAGGEFSLTVTAPSRPTVSGQPDWVKVKDGIYHSDTYKITYAITVERNNSTARKATLSVKAGSLSKTIPVEQEGLNIPPVDKSKIRKTPVNANATASAKKLYTFLYNNYGEKTLSGVQSSESNTNDYVNAVFSVTGAHPALAGYDFIFLQFSPTPSNWTWVEDYTDISAQKEQWNAGGVVNYMWHWNAPKDETVFRNNDASEGNYAFYTPGAHNGEGETNFDIREALKEGTWQHEFILADIDEIAITLKKLQDEDIPILFRPLHEAAGNYTRYNPEGGAWFWWGRYGASYCKQLWNLLQDRLQQVHGLNNILWVWTMDVAPGYEDAAAEWYPGDDRVDFVGFDVYEENTGAKTTAFNFLQTVTGGKKILTVSECGNIPSPEENLSAGLPWSWFMVWPTSNPVNINGYRLNTDAYWKSLMSSDFVYTRENLTLNK